MRSAPPFRQFVVKVHGRCDLACDYCYVYEMADRRWRSRPALMSERTAADLVARIAEHVVAHGIERVEVVLHGGEPLLAGPARIEALVRAARAVVPAAVGFTVQTNGVRLDERFLRLFAELNVRVGVSLDGTKAGHDRHRKRHNGAGSHDAVAAAVRKLAGPDFRHIFAGLLCVVDLAADPLATYRELLRFGPPEVDFLLPHGTWSQPPPGRRPDSSTPYADWLIPVFDEWYGSGAPTTSVRQFSEMVTLWLGGASGVEGLGPLTSPPVVVGTDGAIELSDIVAAVDPSAVDTGLNVATDPFDAVVLPEQVLSPLCVACPVLEACGGGHPAHRYRAGQGFAHPSVYCADLYRLTSHVRARLAHDLAALR
ncbi:FxsB family cyclophane-forming radical SAM/SPASM peptide maturase [Actinokineospora inagensis]|uniref:FxsB family cyclophane-forming radical SAM/SPASM peptide maturase n=1 Tax=Actinokineospora inagensis TaxID=103730 RepID=UPI0003F7ABDD|nr:FxsB family cyclophane-forming radical SAM/SPASM peptide maturase [Actinokineospora inagensis]